MRAVVVVAWHSEPQIAAFLEAWSLSANDSRIHLRHDFDHNGCAATKNAGIADAILNGAEMIVVLDDDCFPSDEATTLDELIAKHAAALSPQPVAMFEPVTDPPSRGTPYFNRSLVMPVAASMGFWRDVGDYDACAQLVHGARKPMAFRREAMFGRYFPLCGMNLAFHANWWPWCQFIDVPRFDDIWQGFLWQKAAYARGFCFNLNGPLVRHSRQSNVWQNLRDEAPNLERNETIWQKIHASSAIRYEDLRRLI